MDRLVILEKLAQFADPDLMKEYNIAKAREAGKAAGAGGFSFRGFAGKVGTGAAIAIGLIGATKIIDLIIEKITAMGAKAESKEYFMKMMEAHPTLANVDPELLAKYWASLYHFAPDMAKDPLAAGAYIKQSIMKLSHEQFGGPPPETFSTLANIQKSMGTGDVSLTDSARKKAVDSVIGTLF